MATVEQTTDGQFQTMVLESDLPVLVDFYATWCGPCKFAAPVLEKLAAEYDQRVRIVKIDVDENPETSMKFGVQSIPTVIVFDKGAVKDRKVGFGGEQVYRALIEALAK